MSVRRAAARAGCRVRALDVRAMTLGAPIRVTSSLACRDGWMAGKLLLALAIEDSLTPGAKRLAAELRERAPSDDAFARALHALVLERVRFKREQSESFESGGYTLEQGEGDCDAHFRLMYAVAVAGGLPAGLVLLHHGPGSQPAHALAAFGVDGKTVFAETSVAARFGEEPNAAAARLGLTDDRTDIAREVVIMTEKDLAPLPSGFRERNKPEQVLRDAEALQRLGFVRCGTPATLLSDPSAVPLRLAVLAFQTEKGLVRDGLLGPTTRLELAKALKDGGVTDFDYRGLSGLGPDRKTFTHQQAREVLRQAYLEEFGKEPSPGELDFGLATAYFESGYGRAGFANWVATGQFARFASEGLYNWGALQSGTPGEGKKEGKDAGRTVYFYVYPSDLLAARAFLRSWGRKDKTGARPVLVAAETGSATAVSAAMKSYGYYEGFHVGPGGLVNGKTTDRHFVEEASNEIAYQKNVADYASALERFRKIVTSGGGVPDPSPEGSGGLGSGVAKAATVAGVVLLAGGVVAAAAGTYAWWPV